MKSIIRIAMLLLISTISFAQHKTVMAVSDFEKAVQAAGVQLVDVRTPQEFKDGYIKGAVNADWQNETQFAEQVKKLNKAKPVYLYCLSGVRSGKAADWLAANGFKEVINLDGGIKAWKAANKKVEIR
ncbi:MAG: rhodanese-like domain-containing protein [Bacteroidota bacterium]